MLVLPWQFNRGYHDHRQPTPVTYDMIQCSTVHSMSLILKASYTQTTVIDCADATVGNQA